MIRRRSLVDCLAAAGVVEEVLVVHLMGLVEDLVLFHEVVNLMQYLSGVGQGF